MMKGERLIFKVKFPLGKEVPYFPSWKNYGTLTT